MTHNKRNHKKRLAAAAAGLLLSGLSLAPAAVSAAPLTLDQAVEKALASDPRIGETRHLVDAARAVVEEALGSGDLSLDVNAFLGLAPDYDGGFFTNGTNRCTTLPCSIRRDDSMDGVSPWASLQFKLIKPLYTFGKIENYAEAARGQVAVKEGDVRIRRADTRLEVMRAYNGYLAARDTRALLEDVLARASKAVTLVEGWLKSGNGRAKQSDLYALKTGKALLQKYLNQAKAVEAIALDGLKVLTDTPLSDGLEVADRHIAPVEMPAASLAELQAVALERRPEVGQLEAGLRARRALVAARKAESKPNIYAGVVGSISASGDRDELDSPYVHDPFDHAGATPVIGINWRWESGVAPARVSKAQSELNALVEKASFARRGIPFEVAEQYHQASTLGDSVETLKDGSRSGRRWMLASYADFEAGLEEANKLADAFQGYVLAHTDYLSAINDYNMAVAKLVYTSGGYE